MAQLELVIGRIWVGEENERSNIVRSRDTLRIHGGRL